jgi:hypothetical protein
MAEILKHRKTFSHEAREGNEAGFLRVGVVNFTISLPFLYRKCTPDALERTKPHQTAPNRTENEILEVSHQSPPSFLATIVRALVAANEMEQGKWNMEKTGPRSV